jgi:hypothetical protein
VNVYREVLFELMEGRAATPLFVALAESRAARARLQAMAISHDSATVLIDLTGPAAAVARVREVLATDAQPGVVHHDILLDVEKHIRFVITWSRPPVGHRGVSVEHVLHDTVGAGGLLFGRVEDGVIGYKAAAPGGRGLPEFIAALQKAFGSRFRIQTRRTGPFHPGWEIEQAPRRVEPEEEQLLSVALSAGYYDEPKRCGVRELGDALGVSKSVVARRLRDLERRALERMVS